MSTPDAPRDALLAVPPRIGGSISCVALILGEFGHLRGVSLLLLQVLGAGVLAYGVRGNRATGPPGARSLEIVALLVLCAVLFFPPHQAVVQGTDATVYANWGRKVAETGGLMFDDPFVASMPADARAEWFENRSQFQRTGRLHRFPGGFQIAVAPDSTVTASFAPMFAILGARSISSASANSAPSDGHLSLAAPGATLPGPSNGTSLPPRCAPARKIRRRS